MRGTWTNLEFFLLKQTIASDAFIKTGGFIPVADTDSHFLRNAADIVIGQRVVMSDVKSHFS